VNQANYQANSSLIPLIGDVGLAAWKANSRNAHLYVSAVARSNVRLEAYLTIRGQEYLASIGQGQSVINTAVDGVSPQDVRQAFAPGAGMNAIDEAAPPANATTKKQGWGRSNTGQSSAPALPARR